MRNMLCVLSYMKRHHWPPLRHTFSFHLSLAFSILSLDQSIVQLSRGTHVVREHILPYKSHKVPFAVTFNLTHCGLHSRTLSCFHHCSSTIIKRRFFMRKAILPCDIRLWRHQHQGSLLVGFLSQFPMFFRRMFQIFILFWL